MDQGVIVNPLDGSVVAPTDFAKAQENIQHVLSGIQEATKKLLSKENPRDKPEISKDDIPMNTVELLKVLQEKFPNKLPLAEDFKREPECIWRIYGAQEVLQWIASRVQRMERKSKEATVETKV